MKMYTDEDVTRILEASWADYVALWPEDKRTGRSAELTRSMWFDLAGQQVRDTLDRINFIVARELREQADVTIRELVCCDVYEQFHATGERPKALAHHHICYWGSACAEGLRERADEVDGGSNGP